MPGTSAFNFAGHRTAAFRELDRSECVLISRHMAFRNCNGNRRNNIGNQVLTAVNTETHLNSTSYVTATSFTNEET